MGIDVNDVKIWVKDHPLVSGVLLFFYLLYIFLPSLFSMLFYTFPLVICSAILLGKPRKSPQSEIKCFAKIEDRTISGDNDNARSSDQHRRPHLTSQMSRRTFGKDKSKEAIPSVLPTEDDPVISKILEEEILPLKIKKEIYALDSLNLILENTQISATTAVFPDTNSRNKLVEWTEDDQRNLMDLGSSEIERNTRLESLIAKRRAKKILSMQPRRTPLEYLCSHLSFDHHIDKVGVIARAFDDSEHHHKVVGSTFLYKRNSRNPFDLPYDPQEEKPVLTGGDFEDEFCKDAHKDTQTLGRHGSFNRDGEHPLLKSLPSFFLKKPGFTGFRGDLGVGDYMKGNPEEISQEGNDPTPKGRDTPTEGHIYRTHSAPNDQSATFPSEEEKIEKFEGEILAQIVKREEEQESKDQMSENKEQKNDGDDISSSSSSSSSTGIGANATENKACRTSVKKVLSCLVRPKSKGLLGKEILASTTAILPTTKMEERSLYTNKPRHSKTFSIASDMQVEVSDTGSPTSGPPDPNSPTDRESLVYDGDVDKDANSGDEDLWGASPHPNKLRLHDIIEESSNRGSILPEENNNQEVMDQKSTNGDIIEPRSYCSSASSSSPSSLSMPKGITASQMQGKSDHLAEYLASLPPTQTGSSSTLEDPGPSHVRETSAEVISVQDQSNAIFEMEEDKDESKESKELEQSRESREYSEQTTTTSQPEKSNEDGSKAVVEDTSGVREPVGHENEVISKENTIDQSLSVVESNVTSEKDKAVTFGNPDQGEVKTESSSTPVISEKSTSPNKRTTEANQSTNDMNKLEVTKASKEVKEKMQENKDEHQSATVEEDNKELPSALEAINSWQNQQDRGAYKHDTSFD